MINAANEHDRVYKLENMPYGPYPESFDEVKIQIPNGRGFLPIPDDALVGSIEHCLQVLRAKKLISGKKDRITLRIVYNEQPLPSQEEQESDKYEFSSPCPIPLFRRGESHVRVAIPAPSPELERLSLRGSSPGLVREVSPAGSKRSRDERNGNDAESDGEREAPAAKMVRCDNEPANHKGDEGKGCRPQITQTTSAIVYKKHRLLEIRTCELTADGKPYQTIRENLKDESILIAKYWEEDRKKEVPAWMGAYLYNGYYKQGVKGIYKGQSVAIMQCLRKSYYTISESTNFEHLTAELAALVIAEDTTTKMIQFASERAIQLPAFKWNVDGAFIGQIPLSDTPNQDDPLPFQFMLVVPLLEITDENSIRFNIPHYQHPDWLRINMADALNAFLHFSFLQSNRELVFADLQGMMQDDGKCIMFDPQYSTSKSVAGPWDRGAYGLRSFERDHGCSKICVYLGLNKIKKGDIFPPRPRPKPRPAQKEEEDTSENFTEVGLPLAASSIDPALLLQSAYVSDSSLSEEALATDFASWHAAQTDGHVDRE